MQVIVCEEPGKMDSQNRKSRQCRKDTPRSGSEELGFAEQICMPLKVRSLILITPRFGHELSGELVEPNGAPGFNKGETVTFIPYFNCGVCIACRSGKPNCCAKINVCGVHVDGGMAEYLNVPIYSLVHGEGLSYDDLALVEPLAIGAHGIRRADVKPGEYVLVIGAGPIGLGIMEFARIAGAKVIAMDLNAKRLEFCRDRLKIDHIINVSTEDVQGNWQR
jgi:threonine dehydrogenase-like Zn-dependent dehydrogenase